MPAASKQRIGTIYVATDQTPNPALYVVKIVSGTKSWIQTGGTGTSVPSAPTFYVASTGSDSAAGTIAAPLATVSQGLYRLAVTGWTGQATIVVLDTIVENGDLIWNVPASASGGSPILIKGTVTTALASTNATGGSTGSAVVPSMATVTSGAAGAANAYRGMFMRFTSGANSGTRSVISANDGAGGFTLGGTLDNAPTGNAFVVERTVGKITFTGNTFRINSSNGVHLDSLEIVLGQNQSFAWSGLLQTTACKIGAEVAGTSSTVSGFAGEILDGCTLSMLFPLPSGIVACGSYYSSVAADGLFIGAGGAGAATYYMQNTVFQNADILSGASLPNNYQFSQCTFNSSSIDLENDSDVLHLFYSVFNSPRVNPSYLPVSPITLMGLDFTFAYVSIVGSQAGKTIITTERVEGRIEGTLIGSAAANPGTTNALNATTSSQIQLKVQPTLAGAAGQCKVGALAVATWATVWNGGVSLQTVQTDLANAASQMVRVGP